MPGKPAEKPKVYDAQFNARLQRLERMIGQESGGDSGDGLPSYDNSDIGKVLTVVSEYETTGEAIQSQSVELVDGVGTLDAEKVDVSNWTDGQLVSVVFNGTPYVLELSNIEGSISCGNEYFQLYYNSGTGVMTIEALDAESPVTVSAQYLTEHANADWAEPSGGSGQSILVANAVFDSGSLRLDKTWLECKNADAVIVRMNYPDEEILCYVLGIYMYDDEEPGVYVYYIDCASATINEDAIEWSPLRLSTDSESGYPVRDK